MSSESVIPESYEQWRYCIEVLGKIKLTPAYISERLEILQNGEHVETKKFATLYGEAQLQRTIEWFNRAAGG